MYCIFDVLINIGKKLFPERLFLSEYHMLNDTTIHKIYETNSSFHVK